MKKSFSQVRILTTIERSGLTDAEIAAILDVSQPTVSRLKNGLIQKVTKYQKKLDIHLGRSSAQDIDQISDLVAMATLSPALRDALIAIQRLMQEVA